MHKPETLSFIVIIKLSITSVKSTCKLSSQPHVAFSVFLVSTDTVYLLSTRHDSRSFFLLFIRAVDMNSGSRLETPKFEASTCINIT